VDNPDDKPQVNHKDGNKDNNAADNLEWMTNDENFEHGIIVGLETAKRPVVAVPKIPGLGYWFPSVRDADRFGFDRSHIMGVVNNKYLSHGGYRWYE
jgi:hypothetical protein